MADAYPRAPLDYYKTCVKTLEVQKKYRDKAMHEKRMKEDARQSEAYNNKLTNLLDQAENSTNPEEKNLILIELRSVMRACENYNMKVLCDSYRDEINELSSLKGFKKDIEKPVPPWSKK